MISLTKRQKEVLAYIENFIANNPYPPTFREVAQHFNISVKGAYDHIKALEKKSVIRASTGRSRYIELIDTAKQTEAESNSSQNIPLLGYVAAGKPIFADENYEEYISVPLSMINKKQCFALRVKGDSMQDAGIYDGDIAVIEHKDTAVDGDIVVAAIDESATLKTFYKEKTRIRLEPSNKDYSPIFTQDARIIGKLRGIIRHY